MKRIQTLLTCLSLIFISACVTTYQPEGYGGGYTEMPLGNGKYSIDVRGNGLTSAKQVQDIAMVRAADLTIQKGHNYFIVLGVGKDIKTSYSLTSNRLNSFDNHFTILTIKMVSDSEAQKQDTIDAHVILESLGPSVGYK